MTSIAMTRTVQSVRVLLVIWRRTQLIPWAVLALVFAVTSGVLHFTPVPHSGRNVVGGLVSIYFFPLVFTFQAVTQTYPFAAGLGLTRRGFARAIALTVTGQAVLTGIVLFVLSRLEQATSGWGESMYFFRIPELLTGNRATQVLAYIAPMLFTAFLGFFLGTVTKRFGLVGVIVAVFTVIVVGGAAAVIVSWQQDWTVLWDRVAGLTAFGLLVGTPAVLAVLLAGAGWGVLRRAVA
jgi:hypothetical protein